MPSEEVWGGGKFRQMFIQGAGWTAIILLNEVKGRGTSYASQKDKSQGRHQVKGWDHWPPLGMSKSLNFHAMVSR